MSLAVFWIGLFFLGVALNALFAGYETGFVACNPIRVRHLAKKEKRGRAKALLAYLDRPERMITVVLIGTNLALIMGTVAITRQVGEVWATAIATPLFLIFGEVVPKSMFRLHPTRFALALLPVIRCFEVLFLPLVLPLHFLSKKLLSSTKSSGRSAFMRSEEDLRVLVDESADQGTIAPEEQEMIHSVMDLQKSAAKEVMVPRIEIKALAETASRKELIALLKQSGHTRIPVYRGRIDEIIGIVNAFDVLTDTGPVEDNIARYIEDILHVPDSMKLDDVLEALREAKQNMAIVTDEYGGTDGLITIEDILEEIFGEIHDEYDKDEASIRRVGPRAFVIDTRMTLEDASQAMGVQFAGQDVETVAGWVMQATGRIPALGEEILHDRFRITILGGGPNHLSSLRIEILTPDMENDD